MDNTGYTPEEPIAAIATALAPSALGIVRASGRGCIALLSKIFSRPKALLEAGGNTIVYGWIVDGDERIDEVLVSVFKAPKSFTGEEMAEISCHGGVSVVTAVYSLFGNLPFIIIQRYNRPRLVRTKDRILVRKRQSLTGEEGERCHANAHTDL